MERRLELLLQGNSPKYPRGSFSFGEKSSCSILWLPPYKEGPVLSHSPPIQLGRGWPGQDSTQPNSQLSSSSALGLPGFTTSSLFPSLHFRQPGLSQCCSSLVWQGREPLTGLSPRSPGAGLGARGWGCSRPGPALVPGTLCPEAIPLPSVFSVSSILFGLLSL